MSTRITNSVDKKGETTQSRRRLYKAPRLIRAGQYTQIVGVSTPIGLLPLPKTLDVDA